MLLQKQWVCLWAKPEVRVVSDNWISAALVEEHILGPKYRCAGTVSTPPEG